MVFQETYLSGAFVIRVEPIEDDRGHFARVWCRDEFLKHGLNADLVQCNVSFNKKQGTLRGMHYQVAPYEEDKLVRCTRGAIYDVIIDLRPESTTYRKWFAVELSEKNRKMLYIPKGFAHGFQTLEDNTEVFYQMSEFYQPDYARGVRWNDPIVGIVWPQLNPIISDKDKGISELII
ncbi:dTDP-4-dehydrorhamnose 3,5-epimerase [Paenibacillus aestuarii]|uniref:dTDP-4-dehydrorhamnose 3,5-epimerase n=1 Tax=Paenibacillus aestuarii TaxID=516965 RepID=A0ABW0K5R1_9BACL|nr:dTDP-4-dehydrorhamnose 3,5-epimerase [Paenibacillus aestuarii]